MSRPLGSKNKPKNHNSIVHTGKRGRPRKNPVIAANKPSYNHKAIQGMTFEEKFHTTVKQVLSLNDYPSIARISDKTDLLVMGDNGSLYLFHKDSPVYREIKSL